MTWRETILAALGLYVPVRVHDQRVHDAANKEQIALSVLQTAQRRAERTMKTAVNAQQVGAKSDDIRESSAMLRESIEHHQKRDDAVNSAFQRRRDR